MAINFKEWQKNLEETVKHPNQQKLDVHEPEKDELTAKDFEMLRKRKKMKEETEQIDEVSYSAKKARAGEDIGKPGKMFAKIAKSAGEKYGSKERGEKVAGAVLAKLRKEEVEQIDELSNATLKSYSDKAAQDVADSAVKSAKHAQIAIGAKKTGSTRLADINQKIADKAQSHANKRVAGLFKASSKMKEEVEQIDELNKDTLVRYSNTARSQAKHDMAKVASATSADELEKHSNRMSKRLKGNAVASRKMQEEGSCKKTYREFVEYLQNNLIEEDYVEIEEELNLDEEQLDEYDAKTGRYVHKGKYGTSYQGDDNDTDDDDDKPKAKPAEPAVKRGRGRPVGSKSGARQQGNSKSFGGLATHSLNLPNRK